MRYIGSNGRHTYVIDITMLVIRIKYVLTIYCEEIYSKEYSKGYSKGIVRCI
jgi:hypothetical protein